LVLASPMYGQQTPSPRPVLTQIPNGGDNPLYKITINVVERSTKAINYQHRGGSTSIDFRGTPLLAEARGEAKVESKQGYMEIEVEFDKLQPATRFGAEYLTYVMWAITPEGRANNLGEVLLDGTKSKLDVTTELQAFGLIVTAEPYFAVTQPSDVVVMENTIRPDTVGKIEEVEAKYELLQRGQYVVNAPPAELKAIPLDSKTPLELYEARNAVRIAGWAGADRTSPETFQKATSLLKQAEDYKSRKAESKSIVMSAREAVQTAEDSRLIALKRQDEMRIAEEKKSAADLEARTRADADRSRVAAADESRKRAVAEAEQRLEAERAARAEAESDRARLQTQAAETARKAAAEQALRASQSALQAQHEKAELRSKLIQQFNLILDTRDSARGLIVNMSDVLFDTGQSTLKPAAREKLAKVAGVLLAHPGLRLDVEGHTDSIGTDDLNQILSEKRAGAVRDYLVQQGIAVNAVSARGLGKSVPVQSNDTAAGRQANRRVEMVVSGEIIGVSVSSGISVSGSGF